jgi:hypothetical protein
MLQEKEPLVTVTEVPLHVAEARPDKESATVPEIVMAAELKPVPSAGEVIVTVGGVLSMLRVVVVEAVFPPASVTVPLICWFAPSVVTVCKEGQLFCVSGTPPFVMLPPALQE